VAAGTPAPSGGGSAVKIILIVVAVIVGLGIVTAGVGAYLVRRAYVKVRDNAHITEKDGRVKIESPLGNMETNTDPGETAKNLGVDLYPGAEIQKDGAVSMTIMGMHTSTAIMQTSDSPSQVADFYRGKLPNANFTGQGDNYSLYSGEKNDMTTISIVGQGGSTKVSITHVTKVNN